MARGVTSVTGILFAGLLSLFVGPAAAHHSFSMFDFTKITEVSGTVKDFQWTNPHSWLQIVVTDADGQTKEWAFEAGGSGALARKGWKPTTVVPGDKVTVRTAPMKDGKLGGALLSVTLPDGRKINT